MDGMGGRTAGMQGGVGGMGGMGGMGSMATGMACMVGAFKTLELVQLLSLCQQRGMNGCTVQLFATCLSPDAWWWEVLWLGSRFHSLSCALSAMVSLRWLVRGL